jgi:hypothetical protein
MKLHLFYLGFRASSLISSHRETDTLSPQSAIYPKEKSNFHINLKHLLIGEENKRPTKNSFSRSSTSTSSGSGKDKLRLM